MNICFFTGNMSNGGGTERMTHLLTGELAKDDTYKIFVLSKSLKNGKVFFPLADNIKLDILDNGAYRGITTIIKDILLLRRYIKQNKIDVLINVDVSLGIFSLPLVFLCPKLKQVAWEHFSFHYDSTYSRRIAKLRRLALRLSKAYITLTPEDAEQFKKLVKKPCLVRDIPNICALNVSEKPYNSDSKTIVSVGNLINTKGFDMALSVAKQVFAKNPDWTWELYGDGSETENLKALAVKNGIEKNFIFKGRTDDLNSLYQDFAMLVMTSRSEGFGLVLIEAQAHRLPVIAFDVPYGPRNIIKNDVNGYLIEPFDIDAMSEKICELIENAELRSELSDNSANDIYKYSAEKITSQWKILLGEI